MCEQCDTVTPNNLIIDLDIDTLSLPVQYCISLCARAAHIMDPDSDDLDDLIIYVCTMLGAVPLHLLLILIHSSLHVCLLSFYTPASLLKRRKMSPPLGDSSLDLPSFHYMSERDRLNRHSATKRTIVLTSLPERCPYRARSSPKNSKKLELGWLEFHSPEPPDPEVARPGYVWIQIPLDFDPTSRSPDPDAASVRRLFLCYGPEGRQWTEWEGNEHIHINDPLVGIHSLASPAM